MDTVTYIWYCNSFAFQGHRYLFSVLVSYLKLLIFKLLRQMYYDTAKPFNIHCTNMLIFNFLFGEHKKLSLQCIWTTGIHFSLKIITKW